MSRSGALLEDVGIREPEVTRYVRHLIREWENSGKTLVDLEAAAGAKSSGHFSQIKSGKLGASAKVVEYMARALEKTPLQIRTEAAAFVEQAKDEDEKLQGNVKDEGLAAALRAIREVNRTPRDAILNAMERWRDQMGKGHPWDWWVEKISDEARELERELHAREASQRRGKTAKARQALKGRRAFRELKDRVIAEKKPASRRRAGNDD